MIRDLDRRAVLHGALVAFAVCFPAGLLQNYVFDEGSGVSLLLLGVIILGLAVGGFVAGAAQPRLALLAGGAASGLTYLGIQAIGIVLRLAQGESIGWIALPFVLLFSVSIGMIGGFVAYRRQAGAGRETEQATG